MSVGDYIATTLTDDGYRGLILEVLDPHGYYSKGLGCYPTHVFRVLTDEGIVTVWDFFQGMTSEFEVICEAR